MTLFHVHMILARTDEYPEGSNAFGYDLVLPLDAGMNLDPEGWKAHKEACTVRRFTEGQPDEHGLLRHIGRGWIIDYDVTDDEDNEPFFKLDRHKIDMGEYLSVTEADGEQRTFRVVTISPLGA
ncbi:MAG: hypothetical protein PW790_02660 [Parvibaculaceae bacterium]|nr:hypothetical protein [Parvibaculaceae bacterium]